MLNKVVRSQAYTIHFPVVFLIFIYLINLSGCSEQEQKPAVVSVTDEQAEQIAANAGEEMAFDITEGLEVSLWASEELLSDPVGLYADHQGRVWVTQTERRRNAELDIRSHSDWRIPSVTFQTVEDRRNFLRNELAPERSEENKWLTDYNRDGSHDWRDLTVLKESVLMLEDTSGNGLANRSSVFIQDFHEEVTDVAGAVLYHEGDLFLGVAPDLWRIKDTNEDGYGDQKESISHGYGVNIGFGGHGMSGLTTGPAGRIYWSIGDRGISVVDQNGKKWHHPREGVIVRSDPDGSNFEVFASGLRNTHEFAFDKYGNLITVDNDGDHAGEHERLVYLVDGSDSGWRQNWQFGKYEDPKNNNYKVLMEEGYYKTRFDDQAAHLLPPLASYHSGPAGMAYNPGTALNDQWNNHFFISLFTGSSAQAKIHAFSLKQKGASFELDRDEQVFEGILATSLSFGPDGALYFTDWVEGWALNQKGRIWKMSSSGEPSPEIKVTKQLLGDDFTGYTPEELLDLLKHPDMRVRKKAQFELAGREDTESLQKALVRTNNQLARIHGIWGLAQIARRNPEAAGPLVSYLDDDDSEIRSQAAKMLGDVRYQPAEDSLISLLKDDYPRVRFFATEALGRLGSRQAFDDIVTMLEENRDEDVYLRHGGAIALERIGDADAITGLADHPSRAVRIAAVVALKRMKNPGVVRFLDDEDVFIVTNAARAINDDEGIEEGYEALAKMLEQNQFLNEPLIRRAINANLYEGSAGNAQRLADFSVRDDIDESLKIEALRTLSVWPESSKLDRVTGAPKGKVENNPEDARQAIEPILSGILNEGNRDVKIAGLETVSNLNFNDAIPDILPLLKDDPATEVRIASLQALKALNYQEIEQAVITALDDPEKNVRINALQSIPELDLPDETIVELLAPILKNETVEERQTVLQVLVTIDDPAAFEMLNEQMNLLMAGELDREIHLDVIRAVEASGSDKLKEKLTEYRNDKSQEDSVSVYREALYGGDAESGQKIFYGHTAAQCMRCHTVDNGESEVGPDLTHVANRLTREKLLESMVDPDAEISPGFGSVQLRLQDGETIRGMLKDETDTHLTVSQKNEDIVVPKEDINTRTNTPSGMPAMGEILTRSELRDLVEFLTTLKQKNEEKHLDHQ